MPEGLIQYELKKPNYKNVMLMESKINEALGQVRQYLQVDGGDIELLGYEESTGTVKVRLQGHCAGCMHAQATLRNLVEKSLKEMIGEDKIKRVINA